MYGRLLPAESAAGLVFRYAGFEEVFLFAQVHDFAHPWEWILRAGELLGQAELIQTAVGDEVQVVFHHRRVHAEHAARHAVACVLHFDLGAFDDHLHRFALEVLGPQVRVFQFDLVDDVDAEIQMHRFVAQNVLELLGDASHFVAAAHRQNLRETAVEEYPFRDAVEAD